MRKGLLGSLLILFAGAGWTFAQGPVPPGSPAPGTPALPARAPCDAGGWGEPWQGCCDGGKPRCWVSAEYLLWWFKDGPIPFPLVTTGDPATNNPGALNAGGRPFLTGPMVEHGALSGARVSAGTWLDSEGGLGIEGSGFLVPRRTKTFRAASDANGNPVIAFRYLDPPDANGVRAEDSFQASVPPGNAFGVGPLAGGLAVVSSSRLWGTEINAVAGLADDSNLSLQALAGFRYLHFARFPPT